MIIVLVLIVSEWANTLKFSIDSCRCISCWLEELYVCVSFVLLRIRVMFIYCLLL